MFASALTNVIASALLLLLCFCFFGTCSFAIAMTCCVGILYCHCPISLHPSACPDSRLSTQDKVKQGFAFGLQKQNQFHPIYRVVSHICTLSFGKCMYVCSKNCNFRM